MLAEAGVSSSPDVYSVCPRGLCSFVGIKVSSAVKAGLDCCWGRRSVLSCPGASKCEAEP